MRSLQDFGLEELTETVKERGFPAFRAKQLYDLSLRFKTYEESTNLPKDLKEKFQDVAATSLTVVEVRESKIDKSKKYLYRLNDGNVIEGVYMPHGYGDTLCVSTQAGCRMGCAFCASGLGGLVRNLTAGEILGQVLAANRLNGGTPEKRAVTNVVLMGSGEPLDNFDEVMRFFKLVSDTRGIGISPRNISLSTCGLVERIKELADAGIPVTLSVSLHAPTDESRTALMPVNKKYGVYQVIDAARYYAGKTGRRVIFEYTLTDNENSSAASAKKLAKLLRGFPCHVNLIRLNYVKEKGVKPASERRVKEFEKTLQEQNISVTVRRSMGADIDGACGQLRRKFLSGEENG